MISPTTSGAERKKISKDLRTYCELDTYAMYQIDEAELDLPRLHQFDVLERSLRRLAGQILSASAKTYRS